MAPGKIVGVAHLCEDVAAASSENLARDVDGANHDYVVFSPTFPVPEDERSHRVVAWIAPVALARAARKDDLPLFRSDTDLRPYFKEGDRVEIDLYQGLVRHLKEGYAFPIRRIG